MASGIYAIYNSVNSKVYIGSSQNIDRRWGEHRGSLNKDSHINRHLQSAWDKYGESSFDFVLIENCEPDNLLKREQFYIDHYWATNDLLGYNIAPFAGAGMRGRVHTEETRIKMKKNHKGMSGRSHSKEALKKMSESQKGHLVSLEQRKNISNTLSGRTQPRDAVEKRRIACTGKKRTPETCKKISDALTGRKLSSEHCKKNSNARKKYYETHDSPMLGKHHNDESKEKNRQAHLGKKHSEESKAKMSRGVNKRYENLEAREIQRQGTLRRYEDPEERRKTGELTSKRYSDPKERKRHSDRMKLWWKERKNNIEDNKNG